MTATISKWGNSQGLRFPKKVLEELNLSIGDKVKFFIQNDKIILEPIKKTRKKYDINELVKQIPKDYKPFEEFNSKSGIEEW
jgi:antitoxin MazE